MTSLLRSTLLLTAVITLHGCEPTIIPHSNVTAASPCTGKLGVRCPFFCDVGFLAAGIHVCQSYTTASGVVVLDNVFFGGRCDPLCAKDVPCATGLVPTRRNTTTADGSWCLATTCATADDTLRRLARGAYGTWRLARDDVTGIYTGEVDLTPSAVQSTRGHIGINGVALMFECVAAEMGWITRADAAARVTRSLSALAGELQGFSLERQVAAGWLTTFFNISTGANVYEKQPYTVLDTGLNSAGVLFARSYFLGTAVRDTDASARNATKELARLAKKVFNLVRFENGILCNSAGEVDAEGTNIPFTLDNAGGCSALHAPLADGFYDFSELHYSVWLSFSRVCVGATTGGCKDKPIENMWNAWQSRRLHPNLAYHGFPLLSDWPSYIVHLPFYSSHSFNTDANWSSLFESHWAADKTYFSTAAYYAGDNGRYGLAAGPTDEWCSAKDSTYEADMLAGDNYTAGAQGCRLFSPYAIAGYLPASPTEITADLLALISAGDTVVDINSFVEGDFVLLRKSLFDLAWNQTNFITLVDFSSELFGLSTLWLSTDFWRNWTNHNFTDLQ